MLVGSHFTDFTRWMLYFAVPGIIATAGLIFAIIAQKGWRILPLAEGLPPRQAPWLIKTAEKATDNGEPTHEAPIILGFVIVIAFLFTVPEGLVETNFENFIVDTYGNSAWITYSTILMIGGAVGVLGYLLAAHTGRRAPEWAFLWYFPLAVAYYSFLWFVPSFQGLLWSTVALQVPATFVQVRLIQSWQAHAYSRRPALLFHIFMTTWWVKLLDWVLPGLSCPSRGMLASSAGPLSCGA